MVQKIPVDSLSRGRGDDIHDGHNGQDVVNGDGEIDKALDVDSVFPEENFHWIDAI